eukprot:TRINITY_DN591_c0_g1_i1.p1 TRINITY_DN591_c0_g1~~TRINITY_DN591_c0_g1_i1.p1  ORF type:complete len:540 (+),score=88.18 TRINITY_DN591_c0_g1_i1:42-1622(+)
MKRKSITIPIQTHTRKKRKITDKKSSKSAYRYQILEKGEKIYHKSIMLFRNDLRIYDNTALVHALALSEVVVPVFILNPDQLVSDENEKGIQEGLGERYIGCKKKNAYRSDACVQFMCESLVDLDGALREVGSRLFLMYGHWDDVVPDLLNGVDAVFVNEYFTPFSRERDAEIERICDRSDVAFRSFQDLTLLDLGSIRTGNGTIYKVFKHFYLKSLDMLKALNMSSQEGSNDNFVKVAEDDTVYTHEFPLSDLSIFYKSCPDVQLKGGATNAKKRLSTIEDLEDYQTLRELPSESTTQLSAYLKFGCISPREIYNKIKDEFGMDHGLLRQLLFRDFYFNICVENPHVFGQPFKQNCAKLDEIWNLNEEWFDAWKTGHTGFPIIDAGMRELLATGYMHNRVRMIVSCFLVKDLLIDWREGEKYFATKLVDYDPCQNNCGWQWSASTGTDSQPYFRVFSPWSQSKKIDKDCRYIKKWVPELKDVPSKHIHTWNDSHSDFSHVDYPMPIVDHTRVSKENIAYFKQLLG